MSIDNPQSFIYLCERTVCVCRGGKSAVDVSLSGIEPDSRASQVFTQDLSLRLMSIDRAWAPLPLNLIHSLKKESLTVTQCALDCQLQMKWDPTKHILSFDEMSKLLPPLPPSPLALRGKTWCLDIRHPFLFTLMQIGRASCRERV